MARKLAYLAVVTFVLFGCASSIASAQDDKKEPMEKLRNLRQEKAKMEDEYEASLHSVAKATNERLAEIKVDYRKARWECLESRRNKEEELRKDYEAKLRPVLQEERALVKLVGRDATEDFAKTRRKN